MEQNRWHFFKWTAFLSCRLFQVEAIVGQRYGPSARRIFRIVQQKKFLEQKQVNESPSA